MKILSKIAIIVTVLVSFSTIICGFSISSQPTIEASSLSFHTGIGVLSVLLSFVTFGLLARD
jgi:hypothetical protein